MTSVVLYAGTFDPVHFGHLDIVARASRLFERVVVGVVDRPEKPLLFSQAERVELFRQAVVDLPNVLVEGYSGLTVAYAQRIGAAAVMRGLRGTLDFGYEHQLTDMNRYLCPDVETVFLIAAPARAHLSASLIKEAAALGADLAGLVPPHVAAALSGLAVNGWRPGRAARV
jgi:pantetheine-phosphate adenylyltransferase